MQKPKNGGRTKDSQRFYNVGYSVFVGGVYNFAEKCTTTF